MSINILKARLKLLNERGRHKAVPFATTEWKVTRQHVSGDSVAILEKRGNFKDLPNGEETSA